MRRGRGALTRHGGEEDRRFRREHPAAVVAINRRCTATPVRGVFGGPHWPPKHSGRRCDERLSEGLGLDRKSTRLNSSHPSISYAVFCLKKKRQILTRRTRTRKACECSSL